MARKELQIKHAGFEKAFKLAVQPKVQTLSIVQAYGTPGDDTWFEKHDHLGDHAITDDVWKKLPALRRLEVTGWDIFERIVHPTIEEIVVEDGAPFCTVAPARPWETPALRSVKWHYRTTRTGMGASVKVDDFAAIWSANAPNLRELDLSETRLHLRDKDPSPLAHPGLQQTVAKLDVFRLPAHAIAADHDNVVATIKTHAKHFAKLKVFEITASFGLDVKKLRKAIPGISAI